MATAASSKFLAVDRESCTARIEAGAFGPDLEEQLQAYDLTLGHFPDSFLHSTLGGCTYQKVRPP
jgi:alkyldihydroxyacetonephosphate synthase